MFGRRRGVGAPLLTTALVIGASRGAARREVSRQNQYSNDAQANAERDRREEDERVRVAIERSKQDEAERDRRTQLAIAEALALERTRNGGYLQDQGPGTPPQERQYRASQGGAAPNQNGQFAPPAYEAGNRGVADPEIVPKFCQHCGSPRTYQDRFCAGCGCKLFPGAGEVDLTGAGPAPGADPFDLVGVPRK